MFSISNFKSSVEKHGVMRNNRFIAFFNLPPALEPLRTQYGYEDALLSLRCETAQLPGLNVTTIDQPRIGFGPTESIPHNLVYDDITLTFMLDAQTKIHKLFYDWMNVIVNFQGSRGQSTLDKQYTIGEKQSRAYEVGYKSDFKTDIVVTVYDNYQGPTESEGPVEYGNNPILTVKMFNAYPKTLPTQDLSWASNDEVMRMAIPFSYTDFVVEYPVAGTSFTAGAKTASGDPNLTAPKPLTPAQISQGLPNVFDGVPGLFGFQPVRTAVGYAAAGAAAVGRIAATPFREQP